MRFLEFLRRFCSVSAEDAWREVYGGEPAQMPAPPVNAQTPSREECEEAALRRLSTYELHKTWIDAVKANFPQFMKGGSPRMRAMRDEMDRRLDVKYGPEGTIRAVIDMQTPYTCMANDGKRGRLAEHRQHIMAAGDECRCTIELDDAS